jgi:hypothetical protein
MKNKIVAISILLLMMCAMTASVFANDATLVYKYIVSITYRPNTNANLKTEDFDVWASSQSEALALATQMCNWKLGNGGEITSCGIPRATGESRAR